MNSALYIEADIVDVEPLEKLRDAILERSSVVPNPPDLKPITEIVKHGIPQIDKVQKIGDAILGIASAFVDPTYDYSYTHGVEGIHTLTRSYIQNSDKPLLGLPLKYNTFDENSLSAYRNFIHNCAYWLDKMKYSWEPNSTYGISAADWSWEWVDTTLNGEHRERLGWDIDPDYPYGYNGNARIPTSACPSDWHNMLDICSAKYSSWTVKVDGANILNTHAVMMVNRNGVMAYDSSTSDRKGFFAQSKDTDVSFEVQRAPTEIRITNSAAYDADVYIVTAPSELPYSENTDMTASQITEYGPYVFHDTEYYYVEFPEGKKNINRYKTFDVDKPIQVNECPVKYGGPQEKYTISAFQYNSSGTEYILRETSAYSDTGIVGWQEWSRSYGAVPTKEIGRFHSFDEVFDGSGTLPSGMKMCTVPAHSETTAGTGVTGPCEESSWLASAQEIAEKPHRYEPDGLHRISCMADGVFSVHSGWQRARIIFSWKWRTQL